MKKIVSVVANLLLSSTLFWGVPVAYGEELNSDEISMSPADAPGYCNMKSPAMREDSLSWTHPFLMMARSTPLISMDHVTMIHSELTRLIRSGV